MDRAMLADAQVQASLGVALAGFQQAFSNYAIFTMMVT
jgi:hypothetical protein